MPGRGGRLPISATVANASRCVLSSRPATTTITSSCGQLPDFSAPPNPSALPTTYEVKVTALGANGAKATARATVVQRGAVVVEMWGDSMLYQDGVYIRDALEATNGDVVAVHLHAFPSTDICLWNDPDRKDGIPKMVAEHRPTVVVLQFWGRHAGACAKGEGPVAPTYSPRGLAQVTSAYAALLEQLATAGVPHAVVVPLPLPEPISARNAAHYRQLRAALAAAVAEVPQTSRFLDLSPSVTLPDGRFTETLPCTEAERATPGHCWGPKVKGVPSNYVRAQDGKHLCDVPWTVPWPPFGCPGYGYSSGATRAGAYVASGLNAMLAG